MYLYNNIIYYFKISLQYTNSLQLKTMTRYFRNKNIILSFKYLFRQESSTYYEIQDKMVRKQFQNKETIHHISLSNWRSNEVTQLVFLALYRLK